VSELSRLTSEQTGNEPTNEQEWSRINFWVFAQRLFIMSKHLICLVWGGSSITVVLREFIQLRSSMVSGEPFVHSRRVLVYASLSERQVGPCFYVYRILLPAKHQMSHW